ncbi:MAG: SRPBCC family protein [Candidatus Desantisbacteria bacterium]
MIKVENTIYIKAKRDRVFSVVSDFEAWPEFIPTYKEVKVIERKGDKIVIERKGSVGGREVLWKSEAELFPSERISSRQVIGPIPDMEIEWLFEDAGEGTRIRLIHSFSYKKPLLIGWVIGRLIVKNVVKGMAQKTLEAIKKKCIVKSEK